MKMMKKPMQLILALTVGCLLLFTGCTPANGGGSQSSSTPIPRKESYDFTSEVVSVPSRSTEIPATLVVPVGEEGETFPLVVFNHSHGGSREENGAYLNLAERLGQKGIATIRMDFAGCGESPDSFAQNNLFNMITDSNAALEYALANAPIDPERLGSLGFGMGGRVTLDVATGAENRYKAIALWAPTVGSGEEEMLAILGGQESYNQLFATASGEQGYAEFTDSDGRLFYLGMSWFEDLRRSNPMAKMDRYQGDLLIICGVGDQPHLETEGCHALYQKANTPDTSNILLEIEESSHTFGIYPPVNVNAFERLMSETVSYFLEKL